MKAKAIKAILQKKHNDFVESIKDEEVKKLIQKNSIITGGSIVSLLLNEKINDFDYYFTDKETVQKVAEYFVKEFNQARDYEVRVVEDGERIKIVVQSDGVAGEPEEYETDDENTFESATILRMMNHMLMT